MKYDVDITVHGLRSLSSAKKAKEFFEILANHRNYLPDKVSTHEPMNKSFDLSTVEQQWMMVNENYGGIIFKNKMMFGSITWWSDDSNLISLSLSNKLIDRIEKVNELLLLTKELVVFSNCMYGYGCHSSQLGVHSTPGIRYMVCLGGITWMTILGPPYVEMFGEQVITSAPCIVEKCDMMSYILLTSREPCIPDPEILARQEKVREHLGRDAFYRHDEPRQTVYTMEELRAGKDRPNTEGYRSPDFSTYIAKGTKEKRDEGLIARINADGTIATYKVKSRT